MLNMGASNKDFIVRINTVRRIFFRTLLILSIVSGVFGQANPNFQTPFKKCWEYFAKNGQLQVVGSDNESNIIILKNNASIISLSPNTRTENWTTEINGALESAILTDNNSIFFITSSENGTSGRSFNLNSISLKTGINRWQKRIPLSAKLESAPDLENLFLIQSSGNLAAINKSDGSLKWESSIELNDGKLEIQSNRQIKIITPGKITEISTSDGSVVSIIRDTNIQGTLSTLFITGDNSLFLGYPTGEVSNLSPNTGNTIWKFKTGGTISSLNKINESLLVTSYDNFLYFFSSRTGKLRWKKRVPDRLNLSPLIIRNYALVSSAGGSNVLILDLEDGKTVNQIQLEPENYILEKPFILENLLLVQTVRGIYVFSNKPC
jgi:outer membrane protein assembly factor BamB